MLSGGGTQFRSGAQMGPRGIREASTLYQFGHKETRVRATSGPTTGDAFRG